MFTLAPFDLELPIDNVGGMPLHPLVVHAAVVLVPLAALGLIVMATSGARSKRYSPAVILVAVAGAVSAFLAMLSGEQLRDEIGMRNQQHFEWGEYLPWAALGLMVIVLVLALLDRQSGGKRNLFTTILALVGVVVAVGTIVLTVLAGHSGAELVWG